MQSSSSSLNEGSALVLEASQLTMLNLLLTSIMMYMPCCVVVAASAKLFLEQWCRVCYYQGDNSNAVLMQLLPLTG
jgi:hypothetical protein